jgi:hypothetical protein
MLLLVVTQQLTSPDVLMLLLMMKPVDATSVTSLLIMMKIKIPMLLPMSMWCCYLLLVSPLQMSLHQSGGAMRISIGGTLSPSSLFSMVL